MRIQEYEAFDRHSDRYTVGNLAALPHAKRYKFYYRILQTFDVLRMHPDPRFKAFLDDHRVRRTITAEATRWITEPWYRGRHCVNDRMPWFKQFMELELGDKNPFGETWEREYHHLSYLLDNISCAEGIVTDIALTLETIMARGNVLFCPSCFIETTEEVFERLKITRGPPAQKLQWLTTVSAPAIARNAFDLGWELRLLALVQDFAVEVAMRKPRRYGMMQSFLKSVERCIVEEQQREEALNEAAAVMLARAGLAGEICGLILPCKTRYLGLPLAMLPGYLKLV